MELTLNEKDSQLEYRRRSDQEKSAIPWGQRKLFINELLFLTDYLPLTGSPLVVYAGAAPGRHIPFLAGLFPGVRFDLYDPAPFSISESETIRISSTYFTDEIATKYQKEENIFFISDIRSADHHTMDLRENEIRIWADMIDQQRWYQIIRPVAALLKFRLPYVNEFTSSLPFVDCQGKVEYLDGILYKQPWAPQTTTECRLVPKGKETRKYDLRVYESQMFYHNVVTREKQKFITGIKDPTGDLTDDFDSYFEIKVWERYLRRVGSSNKTKTILESSQELTRALNGNRPRTFWDTLAKLRSDPMLIKRRYPF